MTAGLYYSGHLGSGMNATRVRHLEKLGHAKACKQVQAKAGDENFGFKIRNVDVMDVHAHGTCLIFRNALNLFEKTRKCDSQPLDLEGLEWQRRCYTQSMHSLEEKNMTC